MILCDLQLGTSHIVFFLVKSNLQETISQVYLPVLPITLILLRFSQHPGYTEYHIQSQLSKGQNRSPRSGQNQKQNQDLANKVRTNTTDNKIKMSKPIGKKHISSTLKNMKKGLDGSESGKLTLLAEIRSLLRRLENWWDDCLALVTICRFVVDSIVNFVSVE
ncbi:hypothetical protein RhiirC2_799229 [Rhizophagus irregularis]|uniref:Uncharacterized protein n=1 Tax=Rhizophagus irregularis TaxID=588596 RepID=A0A2N1M591_9GLOM|nr:hypothetical protein RhiirC2_799229 [Rhizophagus irregularis]